MNQLSDLRFQILFRQCLLMRSISTKSPSKFYDCLEITPAATQNDIKSAYYKLSKQYHPDMNRSSEAASKFREITEAYEVLGNYKLRKLYDKGILHTAGKHYHTETVYEAQEEDDAQTKFYKARMHRSKPTATGRTPIYDFDEWSKNHYGDNFEKLQRAKKKYKEKLEKEQNHIHSLQKEYILLGILTVVITILIAIKETTHYDVDRIKREKNSSE